jgi:hypothetical protein
MAERGLNIAHTRIMRWVHQFGPELDKRIRRFLKPTTYSYRIDETYSGYYKWLSCQVIDKDADLKEKIRFEYQRLKGIYGYRRMQTLLKRKYGVYANQESLPVNEADEALGRDSTKETVHCACG